ncbi:MAG: hypothetical protein AUH85_07950 [Chloroflexi bacterium 13_1_40CM_4_68_4]|nr:MAG: hypothetical protein AUH85_07950 [Chloroflexi bacterium 13_1_40CM_4_68_4]
MVVVAAVFVATPSSAAARITAPPALARAAADIPAGLPTTLQIGITDEPGGAKALHQGAPFGFRYQYLAGGVNTGGGWATWDANGAFVTGYVDESVANQIVPVFSYYMIRQSAPGNAMPEADGDLANLGNAATMRAYFDDLALFFQRAGAFAGRPVVLHVEPDLWGYVQRRTSGDDAATVRAIVGASGRAELAGLPDDVSGLARAIVALRDRYAPNVLLGYHLSIWGTGDDPISSKPSDARIDQLAASAAAFYRSLRASFDLSFAEFSDRDAAFKQFVGGDGGASWWAAADYARNVRFLTDFVAATQRWIVMWQIPLGNTRMRAMNNTWGHYQDNHVEWLLDDPSRAHLRDYVNAGVIAFLFGGGAGGTTCACDATHDGVTDPAPIGGNVMPSLSADDDGGFFRQKAKDYYGAGALALSSAGAPAPSSFHARWLDQSPYPRIGPGDTADLTVRFVNTGTVTWQRGVSGEQVNLGVSGDSTARAALGAGWLAANRVATTTEQSVPPGATATFSFSVRAPSQPGAYVIPLRPVADGVTWLEDYGVFVRVDVDLGFHSRWVSQSAFPTLRPNEVSGDLFVTFRNTGTREWVRGAPAQQANLGVTGDSTAWSGLGVGWYSPNRVAAQQEASVAIGQTGTFTFRVRAPAAPGTYLLPLRPVVDGTAWMEDEGVWLRVTVAP